MSEPECVCEGEFIWACGPECECFHHKLPEFSAAHDAGPVIPTPRKCLHPRSMRFADQLSDPKGIETCGSCGHQFDPALQRKLRNNRGRGGGAELDVARKLGGRKMGPLNLPWDVEMPGYARLQVRKYASPESLRKIAAELSRIGSGAEMPGYVWIEPGRGGEALIVFRLADYAERHGTR